MEMQLVSFGHLKDCGAVDVKMNGSELEEKLSFMILGLSFSSKFYRSCHSFYGVSFSCFFLSEVALYFYQ